MPRLARFLSLLALALSLSFPFNAQSQAPDPERNEEKAVQTRLVVFESFLRST